MEDKHIYLIKDVARLSGLSVYTVKYYLKLGLLKEVARSQETNFRYFDDSTVDILKKIIYMRHEKMSLSKIRQTLQRDGAGCVS